jgi:hypothetical protein
MKLDGCGVFASLPDGRVRGERLEQRGAVNGVSVLIRFLFNDYSGLDGFYGAVKTPLSERYSMRLRQS